LLIRETHPPKIMAGCYFFRTQTKTVTIATTNERRNIEREGRSNMRSGEGKVYLADVVWWQLERVRTHPRVSKRN
jgi:hypothetical protein